MKNELRELWEQKIEFYNLMSMVFMKEPGEDFCNVLWQMLKEDYFPLAENRPDIHTFHEQLRKHLSETTSADFAKTMKQDIMTCSLIRTESKLLRGSPAIPTEIIYCIKLLTMRQKLSTTAMATRFPIIICLVITFP